MGRMFQMDSDAYEASKENLKKILILCLYMQDSISNESITAAQTL